MPDSLAPLPSLRPFGWPVGMDGLEDEMYDMKTLSRMKNLATGKFGNLKIDRINYRVWLRHKILTVQGWDSDTGKWFDYRPA